METAHLLLLQGTHWWVGRAHEGACLSALGWSKEVTLVVVVLFLFCFVCSVLFLVCLFAKWLCYLVCFFSLAGLLHAGQLSSEEACVLPMDLHGDIHLMLQQKQLLPQ